jgi:hypothetical protein
MKLFPFRSYELKCSRFNWAARKLNRRLDQLGAATFIDPYEADEQFPDG